MSPVRVQFAHWVCELELPPSATLLRKALRPFETSLPPQCTLQLRLRPGTPPPRIDQPVPSPLTQSDGSLHIQGLGFEASLSASGDGGWVEQQDEPYPIETVLRLALARTLQSEKGLLVHGVCVAHRGGALLFTGHSGAGKSTLAAVCAQAGLEILGDELVALVPERAGSKLHAHGTPWNTGRPGTAILLGLGTLHWSVAPTIQPTSGTSVLRMLLANTVVPDVSDQGRTQTFRCVKEIVSAVPSLALSFPPVVYTGQRLMEEITARQKTV